MNTKPPLLSRRDLAARWQCSVKTVKRREAAGMLQPLRLGGTVRYREEDITRIEEEAGEGSPAQGGAR